MKFRYLSPRHFSKNDLKNSNFRSQFYADFDTKIRFLQCSFSNSGIWNCFQPFFEKCVDEKYRYFVFRANFEMVRKIFRNLNSLDFQESEMHQLASKMGQYARNPIPTVKLKIPGKAFLKSGSRTSVTFKLQFLTLATYKWQRLGFTMKKL